MVGSFIYYVSFIYINFNFYYDDVYGDDNSLRASRGVFLIY